MLLNAELKQRIISELVLLENTKKEYTFRLERLSDYKRSVLKRTKPKGSRRFYYSVKHYGSKSYSYLGSSDHRVVKQIREVRFLEEAIRRIDRDITLMKALVDGFLPFDPSSVSESLPKSYRGEVPPVSELYTREGSKWKERALEHQKRFPENYPQNKKHTTSDGIKVKTISELVLYERLKDAGLALVYELPLPMKDYGPPMYPDITVLSPIDMKTEIYVEFVGRLDQSSYRDDFARRLGRYINSGYVPGVNLFFVFGDRDGNIDSTQITKVIADIFGSRDIHVA